MIQIDAKLLAELRNLIYLDGRRALLITAVDSLLMAAQVPEQPGKAQESDQNQSEANTE